MECLLGYHALGFLADLHLGSVRDEKSEDVVVAEDAVVIAVVVAAVAVVAANQSALILVC